MKKYIVTETQLKKVIDEYSRSLAFSRKKRLFSKTAIENNPDRFKEEDKERVKKGKK